ncbi:hypothetical protein [Sandaracinus amylolyticus]|uniref:hypothetical protein n=1 Tax=Sandaracinus amylolyticus TaxID=927083 RepID=UPI0012EE8258|nr:hypothetical protein [Sandaracinus amylolyticus]
MTRGVMRLALGLALASCAAPTPVTELMIVVDTDLRVPDELETIRIEMRDGQGAMREASADVAAGAPLPVTLGLVSRTTLGPIDVDVIGLRGSTEVLRRSARVVFVEDQTRALRLDLLASCRAVTCEAGETCAESGCRSIEVAPGELLAWDGSAPRLDGSIAQDDAGTDDASAPHDAGPIDAGDEPIDASPLDGGPPPECRNATECDDGVPCTEDACTDGTCVNTPAAAVCDDGVACTTDVCDPITGCSSTPDAAACDDGNACTTDACDAIAGCRVTPVHTACELGSYCDPTGGCTVAPTFTSIYTTVFGSRCGPCHVSAGTRAGQLDLATQTQAYLELVNVPSICETGNVLVIPRDATRSLLWRKLAGVDLCGDVMPRMSRQLDAASIAQVARWINGGALE